MERIFKTFLVVSAVVFGITYLWGDTTYVSGDIIADTTWTQAGSPYIVTGDVTVDSSVTLTIDGDVKVKFMPNQDDQHSGVDTGRCELIIKGRFIAKGGVVNAETLRVVFTSADTLPMQADWGWINFEHADNSSFKYCIVEYGIIGIHSMNSPLSVENTDIKNNAIGGIWNYKSSVSVNESVILENNVGVPDDTPLPAYWDIPAQDKYVSAGIRSRESTINITNSIIKYNGRGVFCESCLPIICSGNTISYNSVGLSLYPPPEIDTPLTVEISHNTISNGRCGIIFGNHYARTKAIHINLYKNNIINHMLVGLVWAGVDDTLLSLKVTYNTFMNAACGVSFETGRFGSINFGDLTNADTTDDGYNKIYSNECWNFSNTTPNIIMAQGNYWGTYNPDFIDAEILDDNEEFWIGKECGKVIFGVSGSIEGDIIWKNKGVIVTGDVTITPLSTLTLSPGISLYFSGWDELNSGGDPNRCEFIINGALIAKGTQEDSIRFSSGLVNPNPGDWYGIVFKSAKFKGNPDSYRDLRLRTLLSQKMEEINDEGIERTSQLLGEKCAEIERLIVEYAKSGISFKKDGIFKLKNSEVRECSDEGIRADALLQFSIIDSVKVNSTRRGILPRSPTWILNSQVSDCDSVGISSTGVGGLVYKCNVTNNKIGILAKHISIVAINHTNIIANSKYGVYIDEDARPDLGIVTGYNKIYGSGEFDVYNNTDNDIFAKYNYWGTMDLDTIKAHIWDYYDNPTLGKVIFHPIWDGAKTPSDGSMFGENIPHILLKSSPNPFIGRTVIRYTIPRKEKVSLNIYDATGRLVETLVDEEVEPGYYEVKWGTKDLTPGIYFAKFVTGDYKLTEKLILMK